jgi:hypothetical protein
MELPHVVLAEPVLVPAYCLKDGTLGANNWQLDGLVPFRVQSAIDCGGGLLGVAQIEDDILEGRRQVSGSGIWGEMCVDDDGRGEGEARRRAESASESNIKEGRTGSLVPLRSFAARSRPYSEHIC